MEGFLPGHGHWKVRPELLRRSGADGLLRAQEGSQTVSAHQRDEDRLFTPSPTHRLVNLPAALPSYLPSMFDRPATLLLIGCAVIGCFSLLIATSPRYSFHPLCTYGEIYRLSATVDIDGQAYSSQVVRQTTKPRGWTQNFNRAGCEATHGTALSFRLRDNRVVLLRATVCRDGTEALKKVGKIDVMRYCEAIHLNRTNRNPGRYADGFIVSDAERPAFWSRFMFGTPATEKKTVIRLTSVEAEKVHADVQDELEKSAPGLLKASFGYTDLYNRPDEIIPYLRRAAFYRQNKNQFLYDVGER